MWNKMVLTLIEEDILSIELISDFLVDLGALGVEVDYAESYLINEENLFGELPQEIPLERLNHPTEIIAYFDSNADLLEVRKNVESFTYANKYSITLSQIDDEDWQRNWMQYYQPEEMSRFITVVPIWEDYHAKDREEVILMDPGLAFGTGNHATTRLSAQALEIIMRSGEKVIDVGTGTGILSFIAAVLGADEVLGLDLDPQAVEAAQQNLQVQTHPKILDLRDNGKLLFQKNNLLMNINDPVDIIVANILPHILVTMFEDAVTLLKDKGYLILGGILLEKATYIEANIAQFSFELIQKNQSGQWLTYIYQKQV